MQPSPHPPPLTLSLCMRIFQKGCLKYFKHSYLHKIMYIINVCNLIFLWWILTVYELIIKIIHYFQIIYFVIYFNIRILYGMYYILIQIFYFNYWLINFKTLNFRQKWYLSLIFILFLCLKIRRYYSYILTKVISSGMTFVSRNLTNPLITGSYKFIALYNYFYIKSYQNIQKISLR